MFGREGDSGAAHGVVEPGVLSGRRCEEALDASLGSDPCEEGPRSVEKSEEAVPVDGEEERGVGGEEGSAGGERDQAVAEALERQGRDGIGIGKLGHEDRLSEASRGECVQEVRLQKGREASFDRHPDRVGLKERLQHIAAVRVGEMVGERANGGEQGLVQARAGGEAGGCADFGPGAL